MITRSECYQEDRLQLRLALPFEESERVRAIKRTNLKTSRAELDRTSTLASRAVALGLHSSRRDLDLYPRLALYLISNAIDSATQR